MFYYPCDCNPYRVSSYNDETSRLMFRQNTRKNWNLRFIAKATMVIFSPLMLKTGLKIRAYIKNRENTYEDLYEDPYIPPPTSETRTLLMPKSTFYYEIPGIDFCYLWSTPPPPTSSIPEAPIFSEKLFDVATSSLFDNITSNISARLVLEIAINEFINAAMEEIFLFFINMLLSYFLKLMRHIFSPVDGPYAEGARRSGLPISILVSSLVRLLSNKAEHPGVNHAIVGNNISCCRTAQPSAVAHALPRVAHHNRWKLKSLLQPSRKTEQSIKNTAKKRYKKLSQQYLRLSYIRAYKQEKRKRNQELLLYRNEIITLMRAYDCMVAKRNVHFSKSLLNQYKDNCLLRQYKNNHTIFKLATEAMRSNSILKSILLLKTGAESLSTQVTTIQSQYRTYNNQPDNSLRMRTQEKVLLDSISESSQKMYQFVGQLSGSITPNWSPESKWDLEQVEMCIHFCKIYEPNKSVRDTCRQLDKCKPGAVTATLKFVNQIQSLYRDSGRLAEAVEQTLKELPRGVCRDIVENQMYRYMELEHALTSLVETAIQFKYYQVCGVLRSVDIHKLQQQVYYLLFQMLKYDTPEDAAQNADVEKYIRRLYYKFD